MKQPVVGIDPAIGCLILFECGPKKKLLTSLMTCEELLFVTLYV
ncbi:hypothetical protein [Sporosarcina thermotolerans]